MRISYLSPLPPARTGIAHYSAMLLPALKRRLDVTEFGRARDYDWDRFDRAIYQLGNNLHHEWIYREAMERPGVVVLHDVVLHHLIVEMTLARGDVDAYVAALEENHGAAGAAWARGRAAGLHSEMGNFLMPASIALASRSHAVIVHNRWAADLLRSFGVGTPIHVVPHPYVPDTATVDRDAVRRSLGFRGDDRVVGFFGFLTSAKRAEVVLEAFTKARRKDGRVKLLIVGEPAPNIDLDSLRGEGIVTTGYVPDEDFSAYYAAADRIVNLRYPSAGETSGTLVRAFDAGKPVAVSGYAQFAEYPDDCVVKIPFGHGEIDALEEFFLGDPDVSAIARAQRTWLEENATIDLAVDGYARAIEHQSIEAQISEPQESKPFSPAATPDESRPVSPPAKPDESRPVSLPAKPHESRPFSPAAAGEKVPKADEGVVHAATRAITASLPLFTELRLIGLDVEGDDIRITIRNTGDAVVRTHTYGAPEYKIVAKLFDRGREVLDRWLSLPGDLAPGATATLTLPVLGHSGRFSLRLYDGLQSIPSVDPKPWASVEIAL